VLGDLRINEFMAQRFEAFERAFLIRPHQPRIPRHIGGEYRSKAAGGGHLYPDLSVGALRLSQNPCHCSPL
jgi:hypothetical protein